MVSQFLPDYSPVASLRASCLRSAFANSRLGLFAPTQAGHEVSAAITRCLSTSVLGAGSRIQGPELSEQVRGLVRIKFNTCEFDTCDFSYCSSFLSLEWSDLDDTCCKQIPRAPDLCLKSSRSKHIKKQNKDFQHNKSACSLNKIHNLYIGFLSSKFGPNLTEWHRCMFMFNRSSKLCPVIPHHNTWVEQ